MTYAARILLVDRGTDESEPLADKLQALGYECLTTGSDVEAIALAGGKLPEVVLVDAGPGDEAVRFSTALKQGAETGSIPVVAITDDPANPPIGLLDGIDDVLVRPCSDAELVRRLDSLVRLHTMQRELARRAATAKRYGIEGLSDAAVPAEIADARVLLAGANHTEIGAVAEAIGAIASLSVVGSPYEVVSRLAAAEFDVVVLAIDGDPTKVLQSIEDIRANPMFYNLPIIVLSTAGAMADLGAPFEQGADDLLVRPWSAGDLCRRLVNRVRLQRYRRTMQGIYKEVRNLATADGPIGLYTHGFLHAHLAHLIESAGRTERALSVGFFDIKDIAGINANYGYVAGDALIRQIGGLVGMLVRGEDLPARYGGEEFCIVFPDTDLAAAEVVLRRIRGVVDNTEFALENAQRAIHVRLKSGAAELVAGESVESLIARAKTAAT